jgi:2-methylisocitrate lyase-like PEP mutase family enzyme
MSKIVDAGARRVSVGGALTWVALRAMAATAEEMSNHGDFSSLTPSVQIKP